MRLGDNSSALLECLHLETLGIRVSLRDLLVTLVVAATYMAWSSEDRRAEVGDCLRLRSW